MPIQNDADLVKNSGQVGMSRLYDGRSLGLFKFEVADNIQIARRPDGLRNISRAFSATKPGRPNGLPIPAYATIRENVPIVSTVGLPTTDLQRIWKTFRR